MADKQQRTGPEPRGFGARSRGLPGEYAHEQGWGLDEKERTRNAAPPQDTDGGSDYNYGARDFGDEPQNMAAASANVPEETARRALGINQKEKK